MWRRGLRDLVCEDLECYHRSLSGGAKAFQSFQGADGVLPGRLGAVIAHTRLYCGVQPCSLEDCCRCVYVKNGVPPQRNMSNDGFIMHVAVDYFNRFVSCS